MPHPPSLLPEIFVTTPRLASRVTRELKEGRVCFVALLLFAGCSKGPSTEPGSLGTVDIASRLPGGVVVPPEASAHEATLSVCPGDAKDDAPASVHVSWKSFTTKDRASYVSSYAVELERKVPRLVIALDGEPQMMDANAAAGGPRLAAVAITLKCTRYQSSGNVFEEHSVAYVRADGVSSVKK